MTALLVGISIYKVYETEAVIILFSHEKSQETTGARIPVINYKYKWTVILRLHSTWLSPLWD